MIFVDVSYMVMGHIENKLMKRSYQYIRLYCNFFQSMNSLKQNLSCIIKISQWNKIRQTMKHLEN
jgi:hypothetical protein